MLRAFVLDFNSSLVQLVGRFPTQVQTLQAYFNSSLVQLVEVCIERFDYLFLKFQFLIGTISSSYQGLYLFHVQRFQFLIGTISSRAKAVSTLV